MYIGVLSDTHCFFDETLITFFEPVDILWHAGDFGNIKTADRIASFKPLIGVHGNCDGTDVRIVYPETQVFEAEGIKIAMKHIGGYPGKYDYRAFELINRVKPDIFVCGHSHILKIINDSKLKILTINPGAAGREGFHNVRTALRFRIENGVISDMEVGEWEKTFNTYNK